MKMFSPIFSSRIFPVCSVPLLCLLLLTGCSEEKPRVFGTVERDRLTLTAPVNETIASINVVEGQLVSAGQVLLTLDDRLAMSRCNQRQAELTQAQAKLNELVAGARSEALARAQAVLSGSNANVTEAQQAFERTERLFATRVLTQADLDKARANRDTAIAKQTEAKQSLQELENGTRLEQVEQARAAVAAATAALAYEQKSLADLTLVASQHAVVDTLPWRVGDRVAAGTQLLGLLATTRAYVRIYLPATWLDSIRAGSQVKVYVDGREQPILGTVRNIRSQPAYTPFYALNERDRARLMYLADVDIASDSYLPTGMTLEVELP